ncbi:MAG: CatB-related O-acetyltransferase [Planctomycetes bacterium]|nr:CatB-related O-acetyltransferase [Planctomycetota bacterium]
MKSVLGGFLYRLYAVRSRFLRRRIFRAVTWLEGGEAYSGTLRRIFADYHDVRVGPYSYGGCFNAERIGRGSRIGAYCSIASGVWVFNRNHSFDFRSQHPFFFNKAFGYVGEDLVEHNDLEIGNDVYIGCNAIILPRVSVIGDGAVVGAGAIVTKDVEPFAVVAGNPARVIRYRFSPERIAEIVKSKWWEKSIEELQSDFENFTRPVEDTT